MPNYNYITINNYFKSTCDTENPLSSVSPKKDPTLPLTEILAYFKKLPKESLHACTITIPPNKCTNYYEKLFLIEKYLTKYRNEQPNVKYIGFIEEKSDRPHMHLLVYNAYKAPWVRIFKKLGSRNAHDDSFQKIKNTEKYIEYIIKEYNKSDKFYHNIPSETK